jgi:hypothetical protein
LYLSGVLCKAFVDIKDIVILIIVHYGSCRERCCGCGLKHSG